MHIPARSEAMLHVVWPILAGVRDSVARYERVTTQAKVCLWCADVCVA